MKKMIMLLTLTVCSLASANDYWGKVFVVDYNGQEVEITADLELVPDSNGSETVYVKNYKIYAGNGGPIKNMGTNDGWGNKGLDIICKAVSEQVYERGDLVHASHGSLDTPLWGRKKTFFSNNGGDYNVGQSEYIIKQLNCSNKEWVY